LTKLDVMDTLESLKICVAYELDGQTLDYPPIGADAFAKCTPVYEVMPGWRSSTAGITSLGDLPPAAQQYIARLEALTGVSVHLISTGRDRMENIVVQWPYDN